MTKCYWLVEIDEGWFVTDGIWKSTVYTNKEDARIRMKRALWGEGVNTI